MFVVCGASSPPLPCYSDQSPFQFPLFDPIDPEFRPYVDKYFLPDTPRALIQQGRYHRVPYIIGTVKEEFGQAILSTMLSLIKYIFGIG